MAELMSKSELIQKIAAEQYDAVGSSAIACLHHVRTQPG